MTKAELIHALLVEWHLAREPGITLGFGGDGGSQGFQTMPVTWNSSYRELERCIKALRHSTDPSLPAGTFHHFQQRYLTAVTVRKQVRYRPGGTGRPVYEGLEPNECVVTSQLRTDADPLGRRPRNAKGITISLAIDAVVQRWRADTDPKRVAIALEWITREFDGEPYLPQWGDQKVAATT